MPTESTRIFLEKMKSRNYRLAVLNGWLAAIGDACMSPGIVLSTFASGLGASNVVIGLIPSLMGAGWTLPQLVVASLVRSQPYKLPFYRASAFVRTATYLWIVLSSFLLFGHPDWLLLTFLIGLALNALASGVAGLPVMEVFAKIVPPQERPGFLGTRALYGGILAFCTGYLIRKILGSPLPFPYNYTLIFALGALAFSLAYYAFGLIEEPPDPPKPKSSVWAELARVPQILRQDPRLRWFFLPRGLLALAGIADPFYAVYAIKVLGVPSSMLGVFLMVLAAVSPFSNVLWSRVARHYDSRRAIRLATFAQMFVPLLALLMPHGVGIWYTLVFVGSSLAGPGIGLGYTNYMLNLAPQSERSHYIGTMNTFIGLLAFSPLLGGLLADGLGYRTVFGGALLFLMLSWVAVGKLERNA